MSILRSDDREELIIDCNCGCDEGLRMRVNKHDDNMFFVVTYLSGHFQYKQDQTIFGVIKTKLKKIWRIITNQDYCYSEVCMSRRDLHELSEYFAELDRNDGEIK